MKLYITDICSGCCPENVELGTADSAAAERIRKSVMDKLGTEKKHSRKLRLRTLLIAAVLTALISTAAFAAANYVMNTEKVRGTAQGNWTELDENGEVLSCQKFLYPDAGMVFTFRGPEEAHGRPQLRAFWLPEGKILGVTDEEGWTDYIYGLNDGKIVFSLSIAQADTGDCRYILNGRTEVISRTEQEGWLIIKAQSDYSGTEPSHFENIVNYIFAFNSENGYFINLGGETDMENLERIAANLEVRESRLPPYESSYSESVAVLDIGEG